MITLLPDSQKNVLGIKAEGKLVDSDYRDVVLPRWKTIASEYGKVRCLILFDEGCKGWGVTAFRDDADFSMLLIKECSMLAVVGDRQWLEWGLDAESFLVGVKVRVFPPYELEEAWEWIRS